MMLAILVTLLLLAGGGLVASFVFAARDWHDEELRPVVLLSCCCASALTVSLMLIVVPLLGGPDIFATLSHGRSRGNLAQAAIMVALGSGFVGLAAPFTRVRSGYVLPIPGLILAGIWFLFAGFTVQ